MLNFVDLTKSYNLSEGHGICRSVICPFLTLWFIGCHKVMKFSLETERKSVDIFTDCLKTSIKFSLWCAKSAKCDADVEANPCPLKNTHLLFPYFISDLYPYPPFFRHSSTKRDMQEKHYGKNNTCPNEHDNMFPFHFVPP